MEKALTVLHKLLHPPKWVMFLLSPVVFAVLALIFITGQNNCAAAYPVYGSSAYCLTVLILPLPRQIRSAKNAVMRRIGGTAIGGKYLTDPAFRGDVSLCRGITVNFLYALFRMIVGIRHASVWSVSLAVYHFVLGFLRLLLISGYRRRGKTEERTYYRRTARLLFLLNIPMGGMILLMVLTNSGYTYPGYVIYLSALYTFYTVTMFAADLIRCRRLGSPLLSAARVLRFIAALMSVLGLQTAMITQFSAGDDTFRRTMNAVTGGSVWLFVILTALCMLYRSRKTKNEVSPVEPIRK